MNRLVVVLTALAVIAVAVSLQAVIVLLRRHTVDARRPGPLVERRRRVAAGALPPRLDALELMTAETLGGTPVAASAMWEHLTSLAAHARGDVQIAPPGRARRREAWLHDQLAQLEHAFEEDR